MYNSIDEVIGDLDVLYMSRVQRERFVNEEEYLRLKDYFILTKEKLENAGLICSGTSPDGELVEIVELSQKEHPFFIAGQFHPELKSRPNRPAPLFVELVRVAKSR